MQKFYVAYDIFGHGRYSYEDFFMWDAMDADEAAKEIEDMAANEYCSYGGLHGMGYDESERDEFRESGLSEEEIEEQEWQDAINSVDYVVYTEEDFRQFLKEEHYTTSEIEKIVLDLQGKT